MKQLLVVTYLSHLLNFSVKALILLVLFECKLLIFIFKAVCNVNNAWIPLYKVDELTFFVISEICHCHSFGLYFHDTEKYQIWLYWKFLLDLGHLLGFWLFKSFMFYISACFKRFCLNILFTDWRFILRTNLSKTHIVFQEPLRFHVCL